MRLESGERRRALVISKLEGIAAQCHASLTGLGLGGNAFTFAFALLLGASDAALGLVAALPQFATLSQLPAAFLARRLERKKGFVVALATSGRLVFLLVPFLPFVLGRSLALVAFVTLWAVANVSLNAAGNSWTAWMSDLVPRQVRGRYMSGRTAAAGLAGMTVLLAAGFALDFAAGAPPGGSAEADGRRLEGFVSVFLAAGLAGLASGALLVFQHEPRRPTSGSDRTSTVGGSAPPFAPPSPFASLWTSTRCESRASGPPRWTRALAAPLQDRAFRRLLVFFAVFSGVNGLGNPFWTPYTVENLGADYSVLTVLALIGGLGGLASLPLWGGVADRFGSRPILGAVVLVTATHPIYFLAASRGFLLPIYLDALSSGVMWAGFNLAVFNILLALAPRDDSRSVYYAVFAVMGGLAMGTSSFLAGVVVEVVGEFSLLGRVWVGRELVFAVVTALRLACLPLALRLREPAGRGIRAAVLSAWHFLRGRTPPWGPLAAPRRK